METTPGCLSRPAAPPANVLHALLPPPSPGPVEAPAPSLSYVAAARDNCKITFSLRRTQSDAALSSDSEDDLPYRVIHERRRLAALASSAAVPVTPPQTVAPAPDTEPPPAVERRAPRRRKRWAAGSGGQPLTLRTKQRKRKLATAPVPPPRAAEPPRAPKRAAPKKQKQLETDSGPTDGRTRKPTALFVAESASVDNRKLRLGGDAEGDVGGDAPTELKAPTRRWFADWEDDIINECMREGGLSWVQIAERIPGRDRVSCRARWVDHLDPSVKKGPWTPEEDAILVEAQKRLGNKWMMIAELLPGRGPGTIRNRLWNANRR